MLKFCYKRSLSVEESSAVDVEPGVGGSVFVQFILIEIEHRFVLLDS